MPEKRTLPQAAIHILLAIGPGERHGYAIMREIEALTEGRVRVAPGTLYANIRRLLGEGLIEETDERPDPELDDASAPFLDHLAVELGRYRDVRVALRRDPLPSGTSPCADTRFALTGRLSRDEKGLGLITRLLDCRARSQVWAEP